MIPEQEAFALPSTVESVVRARTNGPLLAAAAVLWIPADALVVDVTYGRGLFWTHYRPARLVAHDLALDGVDFRTLPEADGTVDVLVFDPPYIPQGGRDSSTIDGPRIPGGANVSGGDGFLERYGLVDGPRTVVELDELFRAGLKEASRVLRAGGRLLVKCSDYVTSGRYVSGRHRVVGAALDLGFIQVDEFVHYSGTGPQPLTDADGNPRRQYHSRRAHSFLVVFELGRRAAARR